MATLLESGARPYGSRKGVAASMLLHGALIAGAIFATAHVMLPPREKVEEHAVLYVATPPPPPVHVAPTPLPKIKSPQKAEPAPKRLQAPPPRPVQLQPKVPATPALVAPTKIALSIPTVDLKAVATVSDVVAPPISEPVKASGIPTGGSVKRDDGDGDARGKGLGSGSAGKAYDENQVDRAVEVQRAASPKYPEALRSVGVEGIVAMRFIVSAEGRVEPGSIDVISSPNKIFSDAVRSALLNAKYRAAEAGGNKVRQLVEQSFTFRLDKEK